MCMKGSDYGANLIVRLARALVEGVCTVGKGDIRELNLQEKNSNEYKGIVHHSCGEKSIRLL